MLTYCAMITHKFNIIRSPLPGLLILFNFHWMGRSRRLVSHFGSKTILK